MLLNYVELMEELRQPTITWKRALEIDRMVQRKCPLQVAASEKRKELVADEKLLLGLLDDPELTYEQATWVYYDVSVGFKFRVLAAMERITMKELRNPELTYEQAKEITYRHLMEGIRELGHTRIEEIFTKELNDPKLTYKLARWIWFETVGTELGVLARKTVERIMCRELNNPALTYELASCICVDVTGIDDIKLKDLAARRYSELERAQQKTS